MQKVIRYIQVLIVGFLLSVSIIVLLNAKNLQNGESDQGVYILVTSINWECLIQGVDLTRKLMSGEMFGQYPFVGGMFVISET